jgi:hypothetical protein
MISWRSSTGISVGAKVGASMHSHRATPGDVWRTLSQVKATSGDAGRCLAAGWSRFGSRRARVRIPPSRPITDQFRICCPLVGAKVGASCSHCWHSPRALDLPRPTARCCLLLTSFTDDDHLMVRALRIRITKVLQDREHQDRPQRAITAHGVSRGNVSQDDSPGRAFKAPLTRATTLSRSRMPRRRGPEA